MIDSILSNPLVILVGASLIHFVWQGFAIALLYAIARWTFGADPRARYLIGCLALLALAVAPVVTALVLANPLPVSTGASASSSLAPPPLSLGWLVAAWAAGATMMASRATWGWIGLRRLLATARVAELPARVHQLVRAFGLDGRVRFLETQSLSSPVTFGWLRPVILLPATMATRLTPDELDAVLAHELAHVRRLDFLTNLLQVGIEVLLFFHPAVWWISRAVRVEREYCCDDQAVAILGDPFGYARALTRVAELQPQMMSLAPGAAGGSLLARIERLLAKKSPASRSPSLAMAMVLLVIPLMIIGVACLTPEETGSEVAGDPRAAGAKPDHDETTALTWDWLPDRVARWAPQVEVAARRHGLDPELVAIMVLLESNGQPDIESPMGAVGLMQVIPPTAREIAQARGLPVPEANDMRDPALSLDLGAWLLARELRQFTVPGDTLRTVELAAAAYNAGPTRVREHLDQGKPLSPETERYSSRVRALYAERLGAR